MPFKFLEAIATADLAFEAEGKTETEVFAESAQALTSAMVDPATVKQIRKMEINFKAANLPDLLYDFLSEIVAVKDSDGLLFSKYQIKLAKNDKYKLSATCFGEEINPETQDLRDDVKAVTKHKFFLEKTEDGFKAQVILDV